MWHHGWEADVSTPVDDSDADLGSPEMIGWVHANEETKMNSIVVMKLSNVRWG
jgi:hypothetical protein